MLKIPSNDMMMMKVTTITKILTFTKKKPVCFCVWIHLDVPVRIRYVSVDCWLQKLSSFANFTTCTYTHIHGILWEVTSIFYNFSYLGSSSSSFIHIQNWQILLWNIILVVQFINVTCHLFLFCFSLQKWWPQSAR